MSNDTDADLTALIADVRAKAETMIGLDYYADAMRSLVDAVERLTRERDDARAENERLRAAVSHSAAECAVVGQCEFHETVDRAEAAEAEVADLRTRLANVRAELDHWQQKWKRRGVLLAEARERSRLEVCALTHGREGNEATVYGHHGSVRTCIRLRGTDQWVFDPLWEARGRALDGPQDGGEGR